MRQDMLSEKTFIVWLGCAPVFAVCERLFGRGAPTANGPAWPRSDIRVPQPFSFYNKKRMREPSWGSVGQLSGCSGCPPAFERRPTRAPHPFLRVSGKLPLGFKKTYILHTGVINQGDGAAFHIVQTVTVHSTGT